MRLAQYYAWLYDGSQLLLQLSGFGMILLMLAGVMFPLWPASMRVGVWYLSIGVLGLLGAFFGLAVVRLIFWCISLVILRPGVWIFPNLFEDVGFVSSVAQDGWVYAPLLTRLRSTGRLVHPVVGLGCTGAQEEEEGKRSRRTSSCRGE